MFDHRQFTLIHCETKREKRGSKMSAPMYDGNLKSWLTSQIRPMANLVLSTLDEDFNETQSISTLTCHNELKRTSFSALNNELWALKSKSK